MGLMSSYGRIRDVCGNPIPYGNPYVTVMMTTLDYLIRDARRNQFIFPKFLCVAPFPPVSFVFFSEKVSCVGNCMLSRL